MLAHIAPISRAGLVASILFTAGASPGRAQAPAMPAARADSLFLDVSVGLSPPIQPGDFLDDWRSGFTVRLAAVYQKGAHRSIYLGVAHSTFSTTAILENPEIRHLTFMPGFTVRGPTRFATPHLRVGAGLVRQGLRRVTILDGGFRYVSSGVGWEWDFGIALHGAIGATVNAGQTARPYVEVSYLGTRAAGVTLGYVTLRLGLSMGLTGLYGDPVRGRGALDVGCRDYGVLASRP